MRFGDFLRATVLLSVATATLLAALAVIGASRDADRTLLFVGAAWWVGSVLIGAWLGRRAEAAAVAEQLAVVAEAAEVAFPAGEAVGGRSRET